LFGKVETFCQLSLTAMGFILASKGLAPPEADKGRFLAIWGPIYFDLSISLRIELNSDSEAKDVILKDF
jgi:hypothetical protein